MCQYSYISQTTVRRAEPRPFLSLTLAVSSFCCAVIWLLGPRYVIRFGHTSLCICTDSPLHLLYRKRKYWTSFSCVVVALQRGRCPLASPGQSQFRKIFFPRSLIRKTPSVFDVLSPLTFNVRGSCQSWALARKHGAAWLWNCTLDYLREVKGQVMSVVPGRGEDGQEMPSG